MIAEDRKKDDSPTLTDEAINYIANEFASTFFDMESAARYFMEDEDCRKLDKIDVNTAQKLLSK